MQIILQENVEHVGARGEIVDVAPGYARNFLLPRKLALEASASNLKRLEKIRATLAKRTATEQSEAQAQAELLNLVVLTLARKAGETDQLFGSVTAADLAEGLAKQGFEVDKRRIQLAEPIKTVGETSVGVKLVHDVAATFKVIVVPARLSRAGVRRVTCACHARRTVAHDTLEFSSRAIVPRAEFCTPRNFSHTIGFVRRLDRFPFALHNRCRCSRTTRPAPRGMQSAQMSTCERQRFGRI